MGTPSAAFYCVSSGAYFLGAVALVNSLRLLGHSEPIFVLDCGLSPIQRELLSREATVVPAPDDTTPFLLKTVAPRRHPAKVMVLIDADIIITRPLTELIERAAEDRIGAVEHGNERFFTEWGDLCGGTARPRTYVSSSLVLLGGKTGANVLRLMDEAQGRIDLGSTPFSDSRPSLASLTEGSSMTEGFSGKAAERPFFFADQDVLNAVLASEVDPSQVDLLERRLEAITPFTGLRVLHVASLRCAYEDGTEPYAVHHYLPAKPWLEATSPGVYKQLLVRLLRRRDVAVRVPKRELPRHLRPDPFATARWHFGRVFSAGVRAVRGRITNAGGAGG